MSKNFLVSMVLLLTLPAISNASDAYLCQSSTSGNKYYLSIGSKPSVIGHDSSGKEFFRADADLIVTKLDPDTTSRRKTIQPILISSPGDYMGNLVPLFEIEVTKTATTRKNPNAKILQIDGKVLDGMASSNEKSKDLNEENLSCASMSM